MLNFFFEKIIPIIEFQMNIIIQIDQTSPIYRWRGEKIGKNHLTINL